TRTPPLRVGRGRGGIDCILRVITAADERANPATGIVDHNHRAFEVWHGSVALPVLRHFVLRLRRMAEIRLALYPGQLCFKGILRRVLHRWIERGVDGKPAV